MSNQEGRGRSRYAKYRTKEHDECRDFDTCTRHVGGRTACSLGGQCGGSAFQLALELRAPIRVQQQVGLDGLALALDALVGVACDKEREREESCSQSDIHWEL